LESASRLHSVKVSCTCTQDAYKPWRWLRCYAIDFAVSALGWQTEASNITMLFDLPE